MRYVAEYSHIFFDRYSIEDFEKEEYAIYLIEKGLSELNVSFVRKEDVFTIHEEVLDAGLAIEKLKEILKREFFVFLEGEKEPIISKLDSIEKYVAKMYLYEDFTPFSIMEKFNISRRKLERYFEERFQKSAKEYIRDIRVRKATALIREGKSMEEIAYLVGFGSVKTMTRAFKASCNATPGQFRAHLTENL